jgi:leucyl/phenylalanyl-tRNA--protein transferase
VHTHGIAIMNAANTDPDPATDPWTAGPLAQLDWGNDFGLVAVGGDLREETLIRAYRNGIFPWFDETLPICWWSPDPRAIFEINEFRPSRRLARLYRSGKFRYSIDGDFASVICGCAENREEGTWIIPEMIEAYRRLHDCGIAHSVEVWREEELVGGVYGVAIAGFFAGESMFHRVSNASNLALVHLFAHLQQRGFVLFDTQFLTPHTARLGAREIPRKQYLQRLAAALARPVSF